MATLAKAGMVSATTEEIMAHDSGICLSCGKEVHEGIEPDARSYRCDFCERYQVYALEELLVMGRIVLIDVPME
jgi:CxxC motif-containing protein